MVNASMAEHAATRGRLPLEPPAANAAKLDALGS